MATPGIPRHPDTKNDRILSPTETGMFLLIDQKNAAHSRQSPDYKVYLPRSFSLHALPPPVLSYEIFHIDMFFTYRILTYFPKQTL